MVNSLENIDKSKVYADRVQGLSSVAISGSYNDLSDKPTIPDDSNLVHKTGQETINGNKTFNNYPIIHKETLNTGAFYGDVIRFNDASLNVLQNPTYSKTYYQSLKDTNGKFVTYISSEFDTSGTSKLSLTSRTNNTNTPDTNIDCSIGVHSYRNGTIETYAPTPANSSNTTEIATTAYVNNKHQVVSTLPASPDSDVFYYIPE